MPGPDLRGLFVGSEGTLGIVTSICVRLVPIEEAVRTMLAIFDSIEVASTAVSEIIQRGVLPVAMEMLDHEIIVAVESTMHVGYPLDAGAVLLIEVEGLQEGVEADAAKVVAALEEHGAREVRVAESEQERERLWEGRKAGIGAIGAISPNFYLLDGVVPRTKLPEVMRGVLELSERYGFRCGNIFHAGDGNLHPNIMFDELEPGATEKVLDLGGEIMRLCVDAGGSITGEHGVGLEKRSYMEWIFQRRGPERDGAHPPGVRQRRALQSLQDPAHRPRLRRGACRRAASAPVDARRLHLDRPRTGPGHVTALDDLAVAHHDRRRHAELYPIDGALPSRAYHPRSREEVAALLAAAASAGLVVVPQGGRSALGLGRPLERYDIALDVGGLDRIVAYEPDDLTVTVEAGVTLKRVQALLAEHGQYLSVDPPPDDRVTIGGMLATARPGAWREHVPGVRDLVLGVQVALADGTLVRSGGSRREERQRVRPAPIAYGSARRLRRDRRSLLQARAAPHGDALVRRALPRARGGRGARVRRSRASALHAGARAAAPGGGEGGRAPGRSARARGARGRRGRRRAQRGRSA